MLQEIYTTRCKKDIKLLKKQGKDRNKFKEILKLLINKQSLPAKYKDHNLKGDKAGSREGHIEPDWLLIYKIDEKENKLWLLRTGSHSELLETLNITELNEKLEQFLIRDN